MNRRQLLRSAAGMPAAAVALSAASVQQKQIKITAIETDVLKRPPGSPYYDAIHAFGTESGSVVLRIRTDAGITGWASSSFGMIAGGPRVVQTILEEEVKPAIIGKDPAFPRRIRADLWKALEYQGVGGATQFAIAAVDIAVWDILGKSANLPVYKMLGAFRDRLPVYSMCGWYYDHDDDLSHLKRVISEAMEQGYHAVKIKVGRGSLDDDIRRIRLAQDVLGKGKNLMVDANQVFNRNDALRRGRVYQEMGCFWYEEPLPPQEMEGYAELAKELDMRIATGENLNTKYAFADLISRHGADVVQPDNRRAGGVTEWMEIAAHRRRLRPGARQPRRRIHQSEHAAGDAERHLHGIQRPSENPEWRSGRAQEPGMSSEVSEAEIKKYKA